MNHTIPTETTKLQREVIRLREIIASYEAARNQRLAEEESAAQPAAPAVDAAKLTEDEQLSLMVKVENYMKAVDWAGSQMHEKCDAAEAEILAHVDSLIAKRVPALPVDAADLGKLKALAEAVKEQRSKLYLAAVDCGHSIIEERIMLYRDKSKDGNALSQLADRLEEAAAPLAALVAQQAARIKELERAQQLYREGTKEALVDLFQRMEKSYSAEPTRRITFMDMETAHVHVARLGFGGCLDAAMKEGK